MHSNSAPNLSNSHNHNGAPSHCVQPTKQRHLPSQGDLKVIDPLGAPKPSSSWLSSPPPRRDRNAMDRLEDLLRQRQESLRPSRPLPIRAVPCHPLSHLDRIFPMPTPPDRAEGASPPSASSSPSSPLTRTEQHRKLGQISLGYLDILPWTTPSSLSLQPPVVLENLKEWPFGTLKRRTAFAADGENVNTGGSLSSRDASGSTSIPLGKTFEEEENES